MFCQGGQLAGFPQGAEIARKGLDYLLAKAKNPDGRRGFVHLLAPDGVVLNRLRETYDHAFVLLALSALYQLHQDLRVKNHQGIDLGADFDGGLRSPDNGYAEGIPASLLRHNPQMHVFETLIARFDATYDQTFQALCWQSVRAVHRQSVRRQEAGARRVFRAGLLADRAVSVGPGH